MRVFSTLRPLEPQRENPIVLQSISIAAHLPVSLFCLFHFSLIVFFFCYTSCMACNCNASGSLVSQCDESGICTCKQNVEGDKCDRCKSGTVNLQQNNKYGCSGGTSIFEIYT